MIYCGKNILRTISTIQSGYSFRGKIPTDPDGSIGILQMKDVNTEGIDWDNLSRLNPQKKKVPSFLQPTDIIFCGRGTKIFAVPVLKKINNIVAGQQFFVIRPMSEIPSEYLSWYINSNHGQKYLWKNAGGSSIINVTKDVLENLPIYLPSQSKLEALTGLIKSTELEKYKYEQLSKKRQEFLEAIVKTTMEEV